MIFAQIKKGTWKQKRGVLLGSRAGPTNWTNESIMYWNLRGTGSRKHLLKIIKSYKQSVVAIAELFVVSIV